MTDDQKRELNSLKEKVEEVNKDLGNRFRVVRTPLGPRIASRNAAFVTFEIRRTAFETGSTPPRGAGLFQFQSMQYTIRMAQGNGREIPEDQRAEIVQKICQEASTAAVRKLPLGLKSKRLS